MVLEFVREFGLVLFVYTIGMQVGPGFMSSLRKQGLPLNLMAAAIVLLGAAIALGAGHLKKIPIAAVVGLFSGATTNTPALGAAEEALKSVHGIMPAEAAMPALAYAAAYPFGIVGIIFAMLLLRSVFRINTQHESEEFQKQRKTGHPHLERMCIEVTNTNLDGIMIRKLPGKTELGIIVSRICHAGEGKVATALGETRVRPGDTLLAVGPSKALEEFCLIVGKESRLDLMKAQGQIGNRTAVVTRDEVLGRPLRELRLEDLYGVTVSRVTRAEQEMTAVPDLRLQFGDRVRVIGNAGGVEQAAKALGNSLKKLDHTHFIPVFLGIGLGVVVGTYPIQIPGIPAPVSLGMAGGPLVVALILSRVGRIGPIVWYMPVSANVALRELGIVLFLTCVGLKAGGHFGDILVNGDGLLWMGWAALITVVPLLTVGFFARYFFKLNFMSLCGLLAGSMTDPPALAFANAIGRSEAPSVAYATVYPLTMLLRIVVAQVMVHVF
jgi:putative transport protein